jgi:hypothetical protein
MSAIGTKRTFQNCRSMSAFGGKADIPEGTHWRKMKPPMEAMSRFLLVRNADTTAEYQVSALPSAE